jgi:hypothetical protein
MEPVPPSLILAGTKPNQLKLDSGTGRLGDFKENLIKRGGLCPLFLILGSYDDYFFTQISADSYQPECGSMKPNY